MPASEEARRATACAQQFERIRSNACRNQNLGLTKLHNALVDPIDDELGRAYVALNEAVRLINREKAVLIDVREADEYAAGHAQGRLHGQLLEGANAGAIGANDDDDGAAVVTLPTDAATLAAPLRSVCLHDDDERCGQRWNAAA